MKNAPKIGAMAIAVAAATPAHAINKLEETVLVSSRVETPMRNLGTSVSIVTTEDIEIRGFNSLANVLRYDPSISVVNNGGAGKATSLRIRGESDFRTRIYLDGMELSDASGTQLGPNIEHIMSSGVGRVEILRGPQGVMYGADAGGVINIFSESPEEGLGGQLAGEYGRYGTRNLSASLGGSNDIGDFIVTGSGFDTDGYNSRTTDDVLEDDDGYDNETYYARGSANLGERFKLSAQARSVEGDNEFDTCSDPVTFAPSDRCSNTHDEESYRVALSFDVDDFSGELDYTYHKTDREFLAEGVPTFTTQGEIEKLGYVGQWMAAEGTNIVYGLELRNESIDDGTVDTDRDQEGYFLEYQGSFADQFFVTAGARYDDTDDFGSETTFRVSGAYLIPAGNGEVKLKGAYGTGFRIPSLSEISYNNGPFAFPPAAGLALDSETTEGVELGVGYFTDDWYVETVLFDQQVEDEIFFDLADFSGYLQGNGDSESQGVELIGEARINDLFSVSGNYTYTDAEDADGVRRLRAAKHLANLGLHLHTMEDKLKVSLHLRVSNDSPEENEGEVEDYEVLDLSASYQVLPDLEIYGRIENLTDEDYQELPTYNTSGAAGYIGVRYRFQIMGES